jgi:hypothetical protein
LVIDDDESQIVNLSPTPHPSESESVTQTTRLFVDEPPSYPSSPAVILNRIEASSSSQETPPPKYNKWFSDDIFKQAFMNKMRNQLYQVSFIIIR